MLSGKLQAGCRICLLLKVASVKPVYHKGLFDGVLLTSRSFWQILPFLQRTAEALLDAPVSYLPPSCPATQVCQTANSTGVAKLLPFHIIEATELLGTLKALEMI